MPFTEQTTPAPGGTVHYWVQRCNTPAARWLVFLPGLTATHRLFDAQLPHFAPHYHCLTWDAPCHGASRPYAVEQFTLESCAQILHGILAAERIERPILIGQSLGGYVAQMLQALYPGCLGGVVCIDSAPMARRYYAGWELASLKHTEGMYRAIPWNILVPWSVWGVAATPAGRQNYRRDIEGYTREEFCRLSGHGFAALARAVENPPPAGYALPCPTLLLCGGKDAAGYTRRYNAQWHKTEGHPLVWVPGAGHNSNADAPDFVNATIDTFLQGELR